MFYAVVTFGTSPKKTIFNNKEEAKEAANDAIGKGSCSVARVMECPTLQMAKTADISIVRKNESFC